MRPIKISSAITNRNEASVNIYLNEIDKYELLNSVEEVELIRRFKEGDMSALDKIVRCNLRFAVSVAKKHLCPGITLADLISVANIGLIEAVGRFDETRGFKFISYAVWWIRHAIYDELDQHLRMIRLPGNHLSAAAKIKKIKDELEQKLERLPTDEEIEELAGMSTAKMLDITINAQRVFSLDSVSNEEEGCSLLDKLPDENGLPADYLVTSGIEAEIVGYLDLVIPLRERNIIKHFFGVGGYEQSVLSEIAIKMNLSKERTRQLKYKGLSKMREFLNKKTAC